MQADYHRHDISDEVWDKLKPHLLGQRGQWGGIAEDNRRFITAVFWILRTGAPWRDLPPDYGKWNTVRQRFLRWRNSGFLGRIVVHHNRSGERWTWLDYDRRVVHQSTSPCCGRGRRQSRHGVHKRGLNSKIHLAVDENGMPGRMHCHSRYR